MNREKIEAICKRIRKNIFIEAYYAGGGHMGAAFSVTEILSTLYFGNIIKYDAKNPNWDERDKVILSKGHASLALYAVLIEAGFMPKEMLKKVCQPDSILGGHPRIGVIPGVEASTGALGHGLSFGIGIALANKIDRNDSHTYVILGDGECQEGSIWEGALSAPTLKLGNLTVIVDHNKLQAMDELETIVKMQPFIDKWRAFGWNVEEVDGHDVCEIAQAVTKRVVNQPTLVIANTIKGKGVYFMESIPIWHYRMPNADELPILMEELGITREELGIV